MLAVSHGLDEKMWRVSADIDSVRASIIEIARSLHELGDESPTDFLDLRWHRLIDRLADIVVEAEQIR